MVKSFASTVVLLNATSTKQLRIPRGFFTRRYKSFVRARASRRMLIEDDRGGHSQRHKLRIFGHKMRKNFLCLTRLHGDASTVLRRFPSRSCVGLAMISKLLARAMRSLSPSGTHDAVFLLARRGNNSVVHPPTKTTSPNSGPRRFAARLRSSMLELAIFRSFQPDF